MIYNMRTIIALLVLTCSVFGHSKRFVSRRGNRGGYDEIPVLSVGKDSLNGINIANKIRRFFKSGGKMAKKTEPETNDFTKDDTANATFIGNEDFITAVHQSLLSDKAVVEGWDGGRVPAFPEFHGSAFYEDKLQGGHLNRGAKPNYRNVEHLEGVGLGTDFASNDPQPEGMSRPKVPLLTGNRPKKKKPTVSTNGGIGSHVNIVAPGYINSPAGHTSKITKCVTKDGDEKCVKEGSDDGANMWMATEGLDDKVNGVNYGPAPPGHGTIVFSRPQFRPGGIGASNLVFPNSPQQKPNFMNMLASSTMGTTRAPPPTTKRTTPRPRHPTTAPPAPSSSMMTPHALHDAIMNPMMMAMGTLLAMAGAYMAIAIEELNAANAFAFAQLAAAGGGGKKKK